MNLTVKEIVEEFLIKNKFDGLYGSGCACRLDDLFPCSNSGVEECQAGLLVNCKKCENWNKKDKFCKIDFNFCIGKKSHEN